MTKKNEQLIEIRVMDRSGHRVEKVGFEGALDVLREEMGNGRWLRVVDDEGTSQLETSFEILSSDMDKMKARLLSAKSLTLINALQGGGGKCCGGDLIEIDGKFYKRENVKFVGEAEIHTPVECKKAVKNAPKEETIDVMLINDDEEPIIQVTDEQVVIFNNAYGIEAAAEAIARFGAAVETKWPEMVAGEMEVVELDD